MVTVKGIYRRANQRQAACDENNGCPSQQGPSQPKKHLLATVSLILCHLARRGPPPSRARLRLQFPHITLHRLGSNGAQKPRMDLDDCKSPSIHETTVTDIWVSSSRWLLHWRVCCGTDCTSGSFSASETRWWRAPQKWKNLLGKESVEANHFLPLAAALLPSSFCTGNWEVFTGAFAAYQCADKLAPFPFSYHSEGLFRYKGNSTKGSRSPHTHPLPVLSHWDHCLFVLLPPHSLPSPHQSFA